MTRRSSSTHCAVMQAERNRSPSAQSSAGQCPHRQRGKRCDLHEGICRHCPSHAYRHRVETQTGPVDCRGGGRTVAASLRPLSQLLPPCGNFTETCDESAIRWCAAFAQFIASQTHTCTCLERRFHEPAIQANRNILTTQVVDVCHGLTFKMSQTAVNAAAIWSDELHTRMNIAVVDGRNNLKAFL